MRFQHFSHSKWLIFLPVALFALFAPQPAEASQVGLLVRGYQIDQIPPTKSDIAYPLCGSSVEPFINSTWDYEQNLFGDCGWDSFMLHYTGFIQIPEHDTIEFWVASDDGGTVKIGLEEFGVWQDQGCSATETGLIDIDAGTQAVDAWFYENGGGTCFMFAWNIDGRGWEIVQPEFFTNEPLTPSTTSTLETTTTEPSTTTTEMPASTTTISSSIPPSTVATTTTEQPQTTTTIPETTSSVQVTAAPAPAIEPAPPATEALPPVTEPSPPVTEAAPPETVAPVITVNLPPETSLAPVLSLPNAPETINTVETPPATFLPLIEPDEPLTQEEFVEALSALADSTPEEVQAVVEQILEADLSSDQAEQLVASAEVLTVITGEQAQELFEEIEPAQLSESMASVISDAMNNPDVPNEVKEAFEDTLNIFGNNGFSTYVPLGSNVNVAVRRTIIAGTTILVALPSPAPARRT
jgi:hypothetical protein